jgi:hypothetical protein
MKNQWKEQSHQLNGNLKNVKTFLWGNRHIRDNNSGLMLYVFTDADWRETICLNALP